MTAPTAQRDQSLDSLRGIDVLLMILVNVQGSDEQAFALLKHAEWNGLTVADLVFPVFLFIVGLSSPLALDKPGMAMSWPKILRRTVTLFATGVVLGWFIRPTLDPDMIRWTGVLQRIAIVYLVCAVVIAARRGAGLAIGVAALLLAVHSWMILTMGAPSGGGPSLDPGMGISGWLDQNFIPGRVLHHNWEPEGILSTLPAIATGLIGVAMMRWSRLRSIGWRGIGVAGLAMLAVGLALTAVVPLNKNLWTASFALTTCGIGTMSWSVLKGLWPVIGAYCVAAWTATLGRAALELYIIHTLLIALIIRQLPNGATIRDMSFRAIAGTGLASGIASLLCGCVAIVLSCAVLALLKRRRAAPR